MIQLTTLALVLQHSNITHLPIRVTVKSHLLMIQLQTHVNVCLPLYIMKRLKLVVVLLPSDTTTMPILALVFSHFSIISQTTLALALTI